MTMSAIRFAIAIRLRSSYGVHTSTLSFISAIFPVYLFIFIVFGLVFMICSLVFVDIAVAAATAADFHLLRSVVRVLFVSLHSYRFAVYCDSLLSVWFISAET